MPRRSWQSLSTEPRYSSGVRIVASIHGSSISRICITSGMSTGLWISISRAVAQLHLVDDRRRGRDQVEIELALQPLLDDFQMQQPEEAAAEAEAERGARLHLEGEARVVEAQLAHRGAQILELRGIDREQAAEHHRDRGLEAGQHLGHRLAVVGDGVADARVGHFLDRGGEEADLARPELVADHQLRREHADAVDVVGRVGAHHADALALLQHAVDDAHQHDDAEIEVVPAVDQQRLERSRRGRPSAAAGA